MKIQRFGEFLITVVYYQYRKQAIQMIKRIGDLWVLFDSDGRRVLGKHKTKKEAEGQEAAINIAKAIKTRHRKKKK